MNIISVNQVLLIKHVPHFTITQLRLTDIVKDLLKSLDRKFTLFGNKIVTFEMDSDNLRVIRIFSFYKYIEIFFYTFQNGKTRFSIL
jgi:hypothetical protein